MKTARIAEKPVGVVYNPVAGVMVMDFVDRGRYIYYGVPRSIHGILRRATARVHAQFINDAGHHYSVINGIEAR